MGKRAIVMGATSGIGKEVALLLAKRGWTVGIAGRREALLKRVEESEDDIVCHRSIDITKDDAPIRLKELIEELGGLDLYFHSSGIGWQNCELEPEKELLTVNTNAVGFTRMVDAAFNWFCQTYSKERKSERHKPTIACITSIAGTRGLGAAPAYSASKRFQSHYLEALAQLASIRKQPIRIVDIRPGFVSTNLIAGSNFPLQMKPQHIAKDIVAGIEKGKDIVTIDWKYRMLVALWRLLPRSLWTRLTINEVHPSNEKTD